jgi:MarR family transcriptional regulator, lower aerobic nicotinate degradation pathway regulator
MVVKPDSASTPELVDSLVQLSFAIQDVLARASAEHGLSVTQLRLLGILRDRTPPMTAIAEYLGLDRSSVTGLVGRAEQRGLVSRTVATHDARVTIVSVTSKGRRVGNQVASIVATEIDALVRRVSTTERDSLIRMAGSVLDARAGPGPTSTFR